MAKAVLVPGTRFLLDREVDAQPGVFLYVGLATTIAFATELALDDLPTVDCDDPDTPPAAQHYVKRTAWDLTFSGRVDVVAFRTIEADQQARDPHVYRVRMGAAGRGRAYAGLVFFEHLERQSQDRGFVAFSATCRGTGALSISDF